MDRKEARNARTRTDEERFVRRVWLTVIIVTVVLIALFVLWEASNLILVVFAGGLFAVLLHSISQWIHAHTPLPRRAALFATLATIVIVVVLVSWFTAPAISEQANRLRPTLMETLNQLEGQLNGLAGDATGEDSQSLLEQFMSLGSDLFGRVSNLFSTAAGFITNFVVLIFVGIYFAYEPGTYINGLLTLAPADRRAVVLDIIEETYYTLQWWLAGRLAAMIILGALAITGLLLLDIPLALVLGALVGIFEFIPYLGPLLAFIPALLIALGQSTSQALYVVALIGGLQILESYILTPIIEKRVVSLPPVLLISSQLILGVLFGFWGLLLAPPLVVTARIVIKKLYVERMLGDRSVTYLSEEHEEDD